MPFAGRSGKDKQQNQWGNVQQVWRFVLQTLYVSVLKVAQARQHNNSSSRCIELLDCQNTVIVTCAITGLAHLPPGAAGGS